MPQAQPPPPRAEEHPHLVELPRCPYDTARVIYRLCSIDGFIAWGGNRYAIPYDHDQALRFGYLSQPIDWQASVDQQLLDEAATNLRRS